MNKKCIGCGCILQDNDISQVGYTNDLKNKYCRRCFRLKNYGEKNLHEQIDAEKIISKVNKGGVAFFLLDYLNINKNTISIFNQIKIPKILVISKCDILRKEVPLNKIKEWLHQIYNIDTDILFISSKNHIKSHNILKYLETNNIPKAYIMGITNAGKSSYLNKLLKENKKNLEILATNKPNTTLDFITININGYTLIDTPGFPYENDELFISNDLIKPISYQIKANTTLVIANKYYLFFNQANKVIFYGNAPITRDYKLKENKYNLTITPNSDIVFPGIGFINIKDKCLVSSNVKNLEIRTNISEVNYE